MTSRVISAVLLLGAVVLGLAVPAPTRATSMPAGFEVYHTYAQMEAVLDETVADHPAIARKFSIGRSFEGRHIWALKISDNVHEDEDEPEVVFDGLIHARERATAEMNLFLIRILTDNYGSNQRITDIVDSTEIFIIPMLNPDGGEWDIASGQFREWRRNRQTIPGSTKRGVDLNRNFGFKWGCCGGSSGTPGAWNYRGPAPFSSPEARAYRDFVNSRVIGGRQQISAAISWHSAGRQVLWSYGYTRTNVPKTMSADDHAAFVALGREMARLNGYRPMQSSDLYVTDGDQGDWAYYNHRIFFFAFEMAAGKNERYYPSAAELDADFTRNRPAVLYLLEQAACPHAAAGLGATHCGPLNDDFETGRGWQVNPFGTDTAVRGIWARAVPAQTRTAAGIKQRANTPSGQRALVTGPQAGKKANAKDVDGGVTSVRSPAISLAAGSGHRLRFSYYLAHNARASNADFFRISVLQAGTPTTVFEQRASAVERNAAWASRTVNLDAWAGQTIRLLVEAADNGPDNLLEAGLDDVRVYPVGGTAGG
ncbi:MAG TPA: M14 family zinc carboxypeptidase, partial [Candidatus Limnocylindria bacterium]|nr:M14 family zinc carboxypeptidase [Candidatus Limnocylindria bacterium]